MLTNRSKLVVKKEMTFWEKIYLPAILSGISYNDKALVSKGGNGQVPRKETRDQ